VHAYCREIPIVVTASDVGKDQQWMAVKLPVAAQVLNHRLGDGNHAVLSAFGVMDANDVALAIDVLGPEVKSLAHRSSSRAMTRT